jgi:hypothetical protein
MCEHRLVAARESIGKVNAAVDLEQVGTAAVRPTLAFCDAVSCAPRPTPAAH